MSSVGSVTCWIRQLKAGDQAAFQELWEGYFQRLIGLARKRLQTSPRSAKDEEDVALSAFDSFFRGTAEGRFPQLLDRDDLWQLLVLLTVRKAANLVKHERREKRGGGKVGHASALPPGEGEEDGPFFADVISREPDPAFATQITEECRRLLEKLPEADREVAVWKMEGHTNEEIAAQIRRSLPTVERKLRLIRQRWAKEITA
jgi:DNA-directed RNA polymerase specialized sigma24 family protein